MDFRDPSSYVSIISAVLLLVSEILPFLPCKPNGLIDTIFKLSPCCNKCCKNPTDSDTDTDTDTDTDRDSERDTEKDIILERLLYSMLDNIDDLEDHKITLKDMKSNIKDIIHYVKNDY